MTLQLLRRTARHVTMRLVGSYPAFSPLPQSEDCGGYFLLRYSTLADSFLLGSGMLCVARTFLIRTRRKRQTDRLLLACKDNVNASQYKIKLSLFLPLKRNNL